MMAAENGNSDSEIQHLTPNPISKVKPLLKELCQDLQRSDGKWSSSSQQIISLVDNLTHSLCGMNFSEKAEIENVSNQIWNSCVLLKSKGRIKHSEVARLRHIAFQVVSFICGSTRDVQALKKQIVMGIKTLRAWLDSKQVPNADKVFSTLNQVVPKIHCLLRESEPDSTGNSEAIIQQKKDLDHDMFQIACLEAELRCLQSQYDSAFEAADRAKELLSGTPKEAPYFSMLAYNLGVDCYKGKHFDTAVQWLKTSFETGKDVSDGDKNPLSQARTLRLLANCYLEWACDDWADKALNAINLANELQSHIAGLHLRLRLLIVLGESCDSITNALQQLLKESECTMDVCLDVIQHLKTNRRSDVGFQTRSELLEKQRINPDMGQLVIALLGLFMSDDDHSQNAQSYAEECITGHNTDQHLDEPTKKQMHVLFWDKAASLFENQSYQEATVWYNYSLSLYGCMTSSVEANLGKLHKNLATCYIHLGQLDKAKASIDLSEQCDPRSAHTQFIKYKIGLETDEVDEALKSLQTMLELCPSGDTDKEGLSIICLAAHLALEKDKSSLAVPALEWLVSRSPSVRQVVTALRCLLRLMVQQVQYHRLDIQAVLIHIRTAYNKLLVAKEKGDTFITAEVEQEAEWFMKISWNLALQCKDKAFCLKELYNLCSQLLSLCRVEASSHQCHQNCLIMSCAGCLQVAREVPDKAQQQELWEEVLQHLEEYRLAERRAHNSVWTQGPGKGSSSSELLVLLFEFEALCRLKESRSEAILDRALTLPTPDPKLFHNMAAIARDVPGGHPQLCIRALKAAIRLHLQADEPDFHKCSVDVRQLIEVTLQCNDEEAQTIFREILEVIDKRSQGKYPEIELLWLMTKSWNHGLQFYNCGKYNKAELWCNLSMKLLKYIPHKESYEEQMLSLYGEIMGRLDRTQGDIAEE